MSSPSDIDSDSASSSETVRGSVVTTTTPNTPTNTTPHPSRVSQPLTPGVMSFQDGTETTKVFGSSLQQFAQRLSAALARFNITVNLSDSNFTDWAPSIVESLQTLCLNTYLTNPTYQEENMTMARHEKLREILKTWMLSHMDVDNARRSRSHLTSYSNGTMTVAYDPYRLWSFVNSYHCSITEARLTVITTTLHSLKQGASETLTAHLDKFNVVLNEFYKFSGGMSETQATLLLISTLRPEYDTTVKMIFMTVKDLTIPKVSSLLLESEVQSGVWANSAVYQLSTAAASSSTSSTQPGRRVKCTQNSCVGPHERQECFELPQNAEKKAAWIAKQEAGRAARYRARQPTESSVRGIKTVKAPVSNSATMMSCLFIRLSDLSLSKTSLLKLQLPLPLPLPTMKADGRS